MSDSTMMLRTSKFYLILFITLTCVIVNISSIYSLEGEESESNAVKEENPSRPTINYVSPKLKSDDIYLYENFDDDQLFKTKWISSKDSKYEGSWKLDSGSDRPSADKQLLLPLKARHYAISSKLDKPFRFSDGKPLIVQYEVQFRDGLDCGGAYVKLLRNSAINDLTKLTDKTPFTIMFGPDKCGSESKLHFILQYMNPKTNEFEEKHWKQAKFVGNLMSTFSDKKHHIFKLVLESNNNFELFLDGSSVGKGNLLEDLEPSINPPKEIVDPNDKKPADWDERPQIEDPDAKKPEDWDEDAPKTIEDSSAVKPTDWLEDESKYLPDPEAKKPEDWEEMDGEWEAPLIENPACAKASGCGEWKPPMIANPQYKGKWRPPKIDNPNYKGKWAPKMIPNPDYFYDENPFSSFEEIGAIAYELWSMADNIAFDNLIITGDDEQASLLQFLTWQDKKSEADATSSSLLTRTMHHLKTNPWMWSIPVLGIALPLFLFIAYCCDTKKKSKDDSTSSKKKKDEPRPDDKLDDEPESDGDENGERSEEAEGEEDEANNNDTGDSVKKVRQRKAKK